jgi:hypothetical protein
MILTSGERAVWAAAFALARKEFYDDFQRRSAGRQSYPREVMEMLLDAAEQAKRAVDDLRAVRQDFLECHGDADMVEHEKRKGHCPENVELMLMAMLGEE